MSEERAASKVDVVYAIHGNALPRDHRPAIAEALERLVPWLADPAQAGLHRVNVVAGNGPTALLSQRARLALRVRRERVLDLAPLAGATLNVGGFALHLRDAPVVRELLPYGTLYAHLVASRDDDELAFLAAVERELGALGVPCRPICGRRQVIEVDGAPLTGFSLMLDGLTIAGSLRVLESGVGQHRRLGCGIFVPHKSAAALRI
jgi:CRISPR-associated protein Cas6